mmetsp:Transcript_17120/g.30026  ORF Transcript_17120/g.30026 Transcript_17120/m.30026 type:complete len:219 (+) Transcript_17120:176-832(+)
MYYVVMEKAEGMDLQELSRNGKLPLQDTQEIIRQLLTGVQALHNAGLVHKDLKLENVMVGRPRESVNAGEMKVKLVDFDTARDWTEKSTAHQVLGTNQYISYEAYEGKFSPASDLFAVGVICYMLLTSRYPFKPAIFDDRPGENVVGHPKMKQIQESLQEYKINWDLTIFHQAPPARSFCETLLAVDESLRSSATDILSRHEFFSCKVEVVELFAEAK